MKITLFYDSDGSCLTDLVKEEIKIFIKNKLKKGCKLK